jgi:lysozyme family protein
MPPITLTPALRREYETLFNDCQVRPQFAAKVDAICDAMVATQARYAQVCGDCGVPWQFIAAVHNMEADRRFDRHLHNGDPLTARTVQVPAGRPTKGSPPFTWEVSCVDALTGRGLGARNDWSLTGTLYQLEGYNGWGYRRFHPHVRSPYLWSGSTHYESGKYVSDGTWSETARSKQVGSAVLLRRLAERGVVSFPDQPQPAGPPLVVRYATTRPADPAAAAAAETLQRWLNTHPGVWVKVDGVTGRRTSDAYFAVTGHYLPGDPAHSH